MQIARIASYERLTLVLFRRAMVQSARNLNSTSIDMKWSSTTIRYRHRLQPLNQTLETRLLRERSRDCSQSRARVANGPSKKPIRASLIVDVAIDVGIEQRWHQKDPGSDERGSNAVRTAPECKRRNKTCASRENVFFGGAAEGAARKNLRIFADACPHWILLAVCKQRSRDSRFIVRGAERAQGRLRAFRLFGE